MIPLMLCLSGFMCYREETVISFRGACLWALAGENGAGKTALFDAIFFALYGEHRLDAGEKLQQLIHQACKTLVVEFDFAVGEDEYRIRRTMSRDSQYRTRQAWHLHEGGAEPIPETHREIGLREWVKRVVGLDSRAFTFSVWLQQGKSDALLSATAKERQHLLFQIIDLSAYERLYQRADEACKRWEAEARSDERRLLQLEPIEDQRLKMIQTGEQQARLAKQAAKEHHLRLAQWRVWAQRWQECEAERKKYLHALRTAEELLPHAQQIEQDVQRACLLKEVLPVLEGIYQKRLAWTRQMQSLTVLQQRHQQQAVVVEREKETYRHVQEEVERQKGVRKQHQEKERGAQQRLEALDPGIRQANLLEAMRNQVANLEVELSSIDLDLDEKYQRLQQECDELEALRTVLPWLRQFVAARKQWNRCKKELALCASQQPELEVQLARWYEERQEGCARLESLKEQEGCVVQEVARAETLLWQCEQREKNFREIDGKTTCSYCGQVLTVEHLERERQKVYEELKQRRERVQQEKQQVKLLQKQGKKEQTQLQKVQDAYQGVEQAVKTLQEHILLLTSQRSEAEIRAEAALQEIPSPFLQRIHAGEMISLPFLKKLETTSVSDEEFAVLEQQVLRKKAVSAQMRRLQSKRDQKQRLSTQCDYVRQQLAQGEVALPVEQQRALKEAYRQVQQERRTLAEHSEKTNQLIDQLEHTLQGQGESVQKGERALQKLVEQILVIQRDSEHLVAFISEKEATLPMEWRQRSVVLSQELLDGWRKEEDALKDASKRLERVRTAQREMHSYRQRLVELDAEKEKTPAEAQRSLKELDQEIAQAVLACEQYEQEHLRLQGEKASVEGICLQRKQWQQQFQEAKRKAVLYKELSRLLGADCLQQYLLQTAEQGIVSATSEFLDRLSGGTLRLGLRRETEQEVKMLDLVGYHHSISATVPQHVKLLSGGQRFQIAVSLALGIGKYTSEGTQRVETVIIDEGFGGLDAKRRQDMVQGLQALQRMLKCIIVVSHQTDFCEQFDNRYYVRLADGCSKISLNEEQMDDQETATAG